MLNKMLIPALLGLTLTSTMTAASPGEYEKYHREYGPMPFEALDLNKDGVVTAEEHATVRQQRREYREDHGYRMRHADKAPAFETLDADKDGSLSEEEWKAWKKDRRCIDD